MTPDIPKFPDFRKIALEDKGLFDQAFKSNNSESSELTFTNFFIWRACDRSLLTSINGNLCVVAYPEGESAYFFEPLGDNDLEDTIKTCFSYVPRMSRVSEKFMQKNFNGKDPYKVEVDRDNSDYVYDRSELATLKGKKYDGKRNRIRKFLKNNSPVYSKLSGTDIDDCLELLKRWKEGRKPGTCFDEPIKEALVNYEALGLSGAAVRVNNRMEAFTIGEKLNSETAVIYIEVSDPEPEGIAQYINQQFCLERWSDVKFINREQDLGNAGLRKAKLSYHPVKMIEKYNVTIMD